MENKTLFLILKKKWFDMILSGEKKDEYRDLTKYWAVMLANGIITYRQKSVPWNGYKVDYKKFDTVTFQLGYKKDAPRMVLEFNGVSIAAGKYDWGAERHVEYFVISLGKILETKNINP